VASLRYVAYGDEKLFTHGERYHGPVFEMFLVGIEKVFNLTKDPRALFLMRHLITFLLFYTGLIFFYLLCNRRFGNWKISLLASFFFILSPRIFAHSFYNSKDLAFLSIFIISIYTMILCLNTQRVRNIFFHALASAILIDIRILGIIVPLLTVIFIFFDLLIEKNDKSEIKKSAKNIFLYTGFLILFVILFWPTLWKDPIYHFGKAFLQMSRYPWHESVLYIGRYIKATNLPWHYIPVWIAISTPIAYLMLFFVGYFAIIKSLFKNPRQFYIKRKEDLIYLLWFFFPLAATIGTRSVLYDAWRQMFFIYPAFLMLAMVGLVSLFGYFKTKFQGPKYYAISVISILLIAVNLAGVGKFMIKYHPFQNVYFNRLAGLDMKTVKTNFEVDYWGLSYKQALEYILENDKRNVIKLSVDNPPGEINAKTLDKSERDRLVYVENPKEADYFLGNYRRRKTEYPYREEYYSIKIDGAKIVVVYRMD